MEQRRHEDRRVADARHNEAGRGRDKRHQDRKARNMKKLKKAFEFFWKETTMRISDREVGGFIISLFLFLGILGLLKLIGIL